MLSPPLWGESVRVTPSDGLKKCNCTRRHRTFATWIRCAIPELEWVLGEGPIALIARCRRVTVTLHATHEDAAGAKAGIDRLSCGHRCVGRHEIFDVASTEDEPAT